jgi:hypothetical protein
MKTILITILFLALSIGVSSAHTLEACEGNFDGDRDVDGMDLAKFKADYGRNIYKDPCTNKNPCNGDFDCDGDVDGTDLHKFKEDYGRSLFMNPCPICGVGTRCTY